MRTMTATTLFLAVLAAGTAFAQVDLDITLSEELSHSFDDSGLECYAQINKAQGGTLTYDFGATPGSDTVTITWSAPPGQAIEIRVPEASEGWDLVALRFDGVIKSGDEGLIVIDSTATLSIIGSSGDPMPAPNNAVNLYGGTVSGEPYLKAQFMWLPEFGKTYRFEALHFEATAPESFSQDYTATPIAQAKLVGQLTDYEGAAPDAGQWIGLVTAAPTGTVPTLTEWGIGLLVLALGGMACRRVRSMQVHQTA